MAAQNFKTLIICIVGIYVTYLSYGIYQEKIYKFEGKDGDYFRFTSLQLVVQCFVNFLIPFISMRTALRTPSAVKSLVTRFIPSKTASFSMDMKPRELVGRRVSVMVKKQPTPGEIVRSDSLSVTVAFQMDKGEKYEKNIDSPEERIRFQPVTLMDFMPYGCSYIIAMMSSNAALKHVNYPTQVLAKSCKLIPVLLFGVLFGHQRYPLSKYICVGLVTLGLVIFNLYSKTSKGRSSANRYAMLSLSTATSTTGLVLLLISLCCDGISSIKQEQIKKRFNPTNFELQYYVNIWGTLLSLLIAVVTGELVPGLHFIQQNPEILIDILQFSLASCLGQFFIFLSIYNFSPIVVTTITTTRKFFTILLSVLLMGNPLQYQQWIGIVLVFIGLAADIFSKKKRVEKIA